MHKSFTRVVASLARVYCQRMPTDRGKFLVWTKVFRDRVAPSGLIVIGRASFGGRFRLDLGDWVQRSIYAFGEWEPVVTSYLLQQLKPKDIFIDIGANIGYYTVLAAQRVGNEGIVHAIEASPTTFGWLVENVTRNRLVNVRTYNVAVSDKLDMLTVWTRESKNLGKSTVIDEMRGPDAVFDAEVRAAPLPSIVPENEVLNARFIKIDVEGAEWLVLEGIRHLLPRLSPRTEVLLEVNPESLRSMGVSVEGCLALFRDSGFDPWVIDAETNQPFYAGRRASVGIKPLANEFDGGEVVDLLFRRNGR